MKYIRHIVLIIIIAIPLFFLFNAWDVGGHNTNVYDYETITVEEQKVYVTDYGECYHSDGCQYLRQSRNAIGLQKAKSKYYRACSVCGGVPLGTITETYTNSILIGEKRVKNNALNVGLTVVSTGILYACLFPLVRYLEGKWEIKKFQKNND